MILHWFFERMLPTIRIKNTVYIAPKLEASMIKCARDAYKLNLQNQNTISLLS